MSKVPCYGCDDRYVTCHSGCERYQDWVKEREILNSNKKKKDEYEDYMTTTHHPKRPRSLLRNK